MLATAIWLLWVLSHQKNGAVIPILLALLLQGMAAWILGRWGSIVKSAQTRGLAMGAAAGLILFSFIWGSQIVGISEPSNSNPSQQNGKDGINWEPYTEVAVEMHRKAGRAVFVDFTASWCLTCQVNERVALKTTDVIAKLKEKNVATLKADWTSYDPEITQALQKFGRNGVPFYLLYSPHEEEPKTLPEILTPNIVLDALDAINKK